MSSKWLYQGLSGAEADAKYNLPPNRNIRGARTLNLRSCDPEVLREQVRVYFHTTYELFEKIFEPLASDEAYTIQPIHKLRHPLIFYLGHTASFFINKLVVAGLTTRINPAYEKMFAVGVDEMSWDDLNPGHYNWPTVGEVWTYRQAIRDRVDSLIRTSPISVPLTFQGSADNMNTAFFWIIVMGCEHERIHIETASVHLRELPLRLVRDHPFWAPCHISRGNPPSNELVEITGHDVVVGRKESCAMYGWDTDYSKNYSIKIETFKASKYLVSNAEFMKFIADDGYKNQSYWDADGWSWVEWKKVTHPWFWVKRESGEFVLRVQTSEIPLPLDWPVEVNHLEAAAFTRWMSAKVGKHIRLPTEAEWLRMWDVCIGKDMIEWGPSAIGNINLETNYASSCPIDEFRQGPLFDVVGNVWQHCETAIYPYPGYRVHPVYDDFSMPTYDGRHFAMKGGAWISTGNEATRDARFAFRRHFFQMIGIRYIDGVEIDEKVQSSGKLMNVLGMDPEVDLKVHESFEEHPLVGTTTQLCYPRDCVRAALDVYKRHCPDGPHDRAMDIMCGAGRATFELTAAFSQAFGVEKSARPLQCAYALKERGEFSYSVVVEGNRRLARTVQRSNFSFDGAAERVNFIQCDPANLHVYLEDFNLILACDVVDTTYAPKKVLEGLATRLARGGVLIVITAFAWNKKITAQSEWLSGADQNDARDPAVEVEKILIGAGLVLLEQRSDAVPFFRPISIRRGEYGMCYLSAWKRL
jgi:5-histidylcysteine sulfoxide synthase/putative 4-mercaptohistidine N1-methyltranferase